MWNRRKFLLQSISSAAGLGLFRFASKDSISYIPPPVVLSTWDAGIQANKVAWEILSKKGKALDAVEKGVMFTESSLNCCVGLGGNPDRDGFVTLDACIMDHLFNCGSVAFLERIKHPIAVARKIMEESPHVMLVGSGAQQFALSKGFALEAPTLSAPAQKEYENWLKKSEYKSPAINIENNGNKNNSAPTDMPPPSYLSDGSLNHDTIGMIALDAFGHLSGSCTTSGAGFKMRGRIGDSPLIGAGLYVDNEAGACVATGQGEDIIRVAGAHSVVSLLQNGYSPEMACKKTIEKIAKIKKQKVKDIQVGFIALKPSGEFGAFSLQEGFSYAVHTNERAELIKAPFLL